MAVSKKTLRTCSKGHKYYKSSDCPVCPICAAEEKPSEDFLNSLVAPARRALQNAGISSIEQLSKYTLKEILSLHGMGPASLPALRAAMKGIKFKGE